MKRTIQFVIILGISLLSACSSVKPTSPPALSETEILTYTQQLSWVLLRLNALPDNWNHDTPPTTKAVDSGELVNYQVIFACTWLHKPTQYLRHGIAVYANTQEAEEAYTDQIAFFDTSGGWQDMTNVLLEQSQSSQHAVYCGTVSWSYICAATIQHSTFVSQVVADVDPGCIDLLQTGELIIQAENNLLALQNSSEE